MFKRLLIASLFGIVASAALADPPHAGGFPVPLPTSMGGTATKDGDVSELVVIPSGGNSPRALSDIAAAALSQPSVAGGGFLPGHILVGGVDPFTIYDSGLTIAGEFNKTRNPGAGDDYYMGYVSGSRGYNSLTTQQFICTVCDADHPGAAVWVQLGFPLAANTPMNWSFSSMSAGATNYLIPGGGGSNINSSASAAINQTVVAMHFHVPIAPGASASGLKITFTLWAWTPGSTPGPTSSPVVCVILETATDCDSTGSATISKGQLFTVQAVADNGITVSGQGGAGLVLQTNPGN